ARDLDHAAGEAVRGAERAQVDLRPCVGAGEGFREETDWVALASGAGCTTSSARTRHLHSTLGGVGEGAQEPLVVWRWLEHAAFPTADRHRMRAEDLGELLLREAEAVAQRFGLHGGC